MYTVYILRSERGGRFYIGHAEDLKIRLALHNAGKVRSTKAYCPWVVIFSESFPTRGAAMRREQELKSWKKKSRVEQLINNTAG